jgi:LmbE family N-acetylglucosaminyl deacetylase
MYIVAHPDDSLLFQSPSLLQNIRNNRKIVTVHLTAGDAGLHDNYWLGREAGVEAAYAEMAKVTNDWKTHTLRVHGHFIVLKVLIARPHVIVMFMRLPDAGFHSGKGTATYGFQSLMQIWQGEKSKITAVDGSTLYRRRDLVETLASMMISFQPKLIAVQDFVNISGHGDHVDHYASAKFARSAHERYSMPHNFFGYIGYPGELHPMNIKGELLSAKKTIFYTYGAFDSFACSSEILCLDTPYMAWLQREYIVGSEPIGIVTNDGFALTEALGNARSD